MHYDPDTGVFTWARSRPGCRAGLVAGTRHKEGYWQVCLDRRFYLTHRLAFLYMLGKLPEQHVDHINRDRGDCRWCNLREATNSENMQNQQAHRSRSSSGLLGASWHRRNNKWAAQIGIGKKHINLGCFDTAEEAHAAYLKAKAELHPFSTL